MCACEDSVRSTIAQKNIGQVKVEEAGSGGARRSRPISLDLLPDFFFSSNFFLPELEEKF
jgi:hypothetical protein